MIEKSNRSVLSIKLVLIVCFILIIGCNCRAQTTPTPFPTLAPTLTPQSLPEFITYISPSSDYPEFQRSISSTIQIWINVNKNVLQLPKEEIETSELGKRVQCYIDGKLIDINVYENFYSKQPSVAITGKTNSSIGLHQASIFVTDGYGNKKSYSWEFIVVSEDPSHMPGLPYEIEFVRPVPDSVITSREYEKEKLVPDRYATGVVHLPGAICFGVEQNKIVEAGEFLDDSGVINKLSFVSLDNKALSQDITGICAIQPTEVVETDRSYIGTSLECCWEIDLDPGKHQVIVRVEKSEPVEFSWWFIIKD
jgi:hypothetical protein